MSPNIILPTALRTHCLGYCPARSKFPSLFYQPAMAPLSPLFTRLCPHRLFVVSPTDQTPSIIKGLCIYSSLGLEHPSLLPLPVQCPSSCFGTWLRCPSLRSRCCSSPHQVKSPIIPSTDLIMMLTNNYSCHHFFSIIFSYQVENMGCACLIYEHFIAR